MAHTYGFMIGHIIMLFEYFPVLDFRRYTESWIKQKFWRYTGQKLSYFEQKGGKLAKKIIKNSVDRFIMDTQPTVV